MRWGLTKADLRRAALRGAVMAGLLLLPVGLALGARGLVSLDMLLGVSTLASVGLAVAVLTLIELRAARGSDHARRMGWAQVWVAGFVLWPLIGLQATWSSAALRGGSLEAGLAASGSLIASALQELWIVLAVAAFYACPWAILAGARLQRRFSPLSVIFGVTALLGAPLFLLIPHGGVELWLTLLFLLPILHVLCLGADVLDARLARRFVSQEVKALQDRLDREELSWSELWILAYVDHEPARRLLGPRAPSPWDDLDAWVRRIATGSPEPIQHAAAAAARLSRFAWEQAPAGDPDLRAREARAYAAVDRWDMDPGPETFAEAERALAGLPAHTRAEVEAAREALVAITAGRARRERETIRQAASRVAALAAAQAGEETTREVIQSAVVSWILRARGRPAPADPTPDDRPPSPSVAG